MKAFNLHIPTNLFFGSESQSGFIEAVSAKCKKLLVVSGGGSIKRLGFYEPVVNELKQNGVLVEEFSGIEPNPLAQTIDRCANEFKDANIELVLAFGGGSVMDAAKAISALLYLHKEKTPELPRTVWPYVLGEEYHGQFPGALPLACIPTTAATASEVTPYAVISNVETNGKSPLAYEFFKPSVSWLNPEYTCGLSETVTADGAADILSHVFENYLLGGSDSLITDRYCESIIKTVIDTLPKLQKDEKNTELRGNLMWCSTLALNGMQGVGRNPSLFPLHAMEHALSAFKHELAHGRGLATLFPSYMNWLWEKDRGRERIFRLGQEIFNTEEGFVAPFSDWLHQCGLKQSVFDLGFTPSDLKPIAEYTIETYGGGEAMDVLGPMSVDDIVYVFEKTAEQ